MQSQFHPITALPRRDAHPNSRSSPLVKELEALFPTLDDRVLFEHLTGARRRGPKGFGVVQLWHAYLVVYYLSLPSVSDLIRTLHDNPTLAAACGFTASIPSQPTFSRFVTRLSKPTSSVMVKNIMRRLVRRCFDRLPGFGKVVAVDSTTLKAWSNGAKRRTNGKHSDDDAGWSVKTATDGKKRYTWGFKAHLLCDAEYELPISVDVTAGNVHDVRRASPLLRQGTYADSRFWPKYVLGDAAYSSEKLRKQMRHNHAATPIIDPNPAHKKAVRATDMTDDWKSIYAKRTAVERLFSRLKSHRRLNFIRVRGLRKVSVHVLLSVIVLQAQAIATGTRASVRPVV